MRYFQTVIVIFVGLLLLQGCGSSQSTSKNDNIVINGSADLSSWNFHKNDLIRLSGSWEFYWNHLYSPEDFTNTNIPNTHSYINVPSSWTHLHLPADGFATYRILLHLPPGKYGIKVTEIHTAHNLFVNGMLLATNGVVSSNPGKHASRFRPYSVYFDNPGHLAEIVIQVSNFKFNEGGLFSTIYLGQADRIRETTRRMEYFDLFIFGGIFIMCLYHFGLFAKRRKDRSPLYFACFCFIILLKSIVSGHQILAQLFPQISLETILKLAFIATYLSLPIFTLYFKSIFPLEVPWLLNVVTVLSGVFFTCLALFTSMNIYGAWTFYFQLLILAVGIVLFIGLVRAISHKRDGSFIFVIGMLFLFATAVNDILYNNGIIQTGYMIGLGLFVFIFSQAFFISNKFNTALNNIEALSEELELKVRERTKELRIVNEDLRMRNEVMDNDLALARTIQWQLIPSNKPQSGIAAFYKPMDRIGGDYFDFITFDKPHLFGVFVSDVSGHGVPAALITSLLKGLLSLNRPSMDNPSQAMSALNEALFKLIGGYFTTAFYGVFNSKTRELTYSNAGHLQPILLNGGKAEFLPTEGRSLPLGVLEGEELSKINKPFRSHKLKLKPDTRLLFYTDGLFESTSKISLYGETFGESLLLEKIVELKDRNPRHFVSGLFEALVEFHGSEQFDDDICFICIDVNSF